MIVTLAGFALGIALVIAAIILADWIIWRLRGRPVCGIKPRR